MFDYSLAHWLTFLSAAILLNTAPGPDLTFILGQTLKGGKRAGTAAMFGIWTGAFGHVLMAAIGLSALLVASATAFIFIKWIGAAYLIWLGVSALRSKGSALAEEIKAEQSAHKTESKIFTQGALVAFLNPKVAIFFLAFLPQFVVTGAGPVWAQLFLHGTLLIVVGAMVEGPLVFAAGRLSDFLRNNVLFGLWLDRSIGAIFVGLGLKLAMGQK